MPKRALPAAPAASLARKREESPERQLHRQRSDESASRASSDASSSSSLIQRARTKKLKAKVEFMRAQYELAEAQEEDVLDRASNSSSGARSRSSRGTDRLSVRMFLDRDKDTQELLEESINRFRAASQASGSRSRELSPVAEDQVDDDASRSALHHTHVLYEHAAGTREVPTATGQHSCSSRVVPTSADRNARGSGRESECEETESFRSAEGSNAADRNACSGTLPETEESNPYLNVFSGRRQVPASDTGSEFMSVRQEAIADSTDPIDVSVPESQSDVMEIEDMAPGDPNTLSARDQELTNSGTTMIEPVGARSLVGQCPMDLGGPSVTQNFTQINQNTVIQNNQW